jgi:hypothetical protein
LDVENVTIVTIFNKKDKHPKPYHNIHPKNSKVENNKKEKSSYNMQRKQKTNRPSLLNPI